MKIREMAKRGMTLLLAAMMMVGTPMTALAAEGDVEYAEAAITNANNAAESGDFTYNYDEETKKISADPNAIDVNETIVIVMGTQTGTVGAEEAVANAVVAADEAKKVVTDAETTLERLKDFTGIQETNQAAADTLTTEVDTLTTEIKGTATEEIEQLNALKEEALTILAEEVMTADGAARVEAADKVADVAAQAEVVYEKASEKLEEVEKEYNKAVYEYNLYAVLYNKPLYGTYQVTYVSDGSLNAEVLKKTIEETMDLSAYTTEAEKEAAVQTAYNEILAKKTAIQLKADAVQTDAQAIQNSTIAQASKKVEQAQADYDLAEAVYNESKKVAGSAMLGAIHSGEKKLEDFEAIKDIVSDTDIASAKATVETAATKLEEVKAEAAGLHMKTTVDITKLLQKISAAEKALNVAEQLLKDTQKYAGYAANYAGYVEGNAQPGTAYARVEAEKDENEQLIYLSTNTDYDLSNSEVVSRPVSSFTKVTKLKGLEVPEIIYEEYLNAIVRYEQDNSDKTGVRDAIGKGISSGDNLPLIYWEIGADGQLTGTYYTSTTQLTTGRYFLGYSFKREGDTDTNAGFHLDGIMFDYTAPVVPDVPETPETPDTPVTPPGTPGTDDTPVTPALFAAGAPVDTGVLGATRTGDELEAAVLGARRGTDQAVLGRRRSPSTGDSVAMSAWAMAMAVAAGAAIFTGTKLVTGKKKEEQ